MISIYLYVDFTETYLSKVDEEGAEVKGTLGLRNRVVVNVLWLKVVVNEARVGCCSAGGFVDEL